MKRRILQTEEGRFLRERAESHLLLINLNRRKHPGREGREKKTEENRERGAPPVRKVVQELIGR